MGKTLVEESDCRWDQRPASPDPTPWKTTPWRSRVTQLRWEANNALGLHDTLLKQADELERRELAMEKEYGK